MAFKTRALSLWELFKLLKSLVAVNEKDTLVIFVSSKGEEFIYTGINSCKGVIKITLEPK